MPVDPKTFDRYDTALGIAKRHGYSPVEVMDELELLLTEHRRHEIRVKAVEDMLRRLERQAPNKLLSHYYGRADGTAAEMFEATKLWLDAVVRNLADKTLEDL